jgi:hypothetical protein
VPQQQDYILRLIEQLGAMIREALGKLRGRDPEVRPGLAGEAIGLALSMDPSTASCLTPASLSALLTLGEVDTRVMTLLQEALDIEARACDDRGDYVTATLRRDQAEAIRTLLDEQVRS